MHVPIRVRICVTDLVQGMLLRGVSGNLATMFAALGRDVGVR
jgi:hypothetical protein